MIKSFRLHEPTTAEEAVSLLAQYGQEAKVYAGGTELLLAMKEGLLHYDHLVNVKTIPGLNELHHDEAAGVLHIGPTVTHRTLELSPLVRQKFPLVADVERSIANVRVRNAGTIGGNLCFAEPHADPGAFLLLFDSYVEVVGSTGARRVSVEELPLGPYETCLQEDEILTQILVPALPTGMEAAYFKFGYHQRPTLGLGVAVRLDQGSVGARAGTDAARRAVVEEARIAVGSVGPKPVRIREAEHLLQGKSVEEILHSDDGASSTTLDTAGNLAVEAVSPLTDLHGSAEYKEHLTRLFLRKAFVAAIDSIITGSAS